MMLPTPKADEDAEMVKPDEGEPSTVAAAEGAIPSSAPISRPLSLMIL